MDDAAIAFAFLFGVLLLLVICAVGAAACRKATQPPHAT